MMLQRTTHHCARCCAGLQKQRDRAASFMQTTIFETPVINTLMRGLSRAVLRLMGWRTAGMRPEDIAAYPKYVLIAAPHTSNWDFPVTLMLCFVLRLKVYWMAKASLFAGPLGILSR